MNTESQNIIKKQLSVLPPRVLSVITGVDLPAHIKAISDKYKLRVDQSAVLEDEIMLVMLGVEHPDTFVFNLSRQGNLPKETAAAITVDIDENIFKAVRRELVELHQKTKAQYEGGVPVGGIKDDTTKQPPSEATPTQTTPGLTRTLTKDIAQTKLEQSFRMPPTTTTIKESTPPPAVQKHADPYREPTE